MKKNCALIFLFFNCLFCYSQNGFHSASTKKKIVIPFQTINNLIIIPVILNDVKLNFLLDTGVEKTVLFSIEDKDSLKFAKVEKIKIKGLGSGKSINGLQSQENILKISDYIDNNHEVYIILEEDINFSSQLGVPVHGIIGYEFFKNYFIEINYERKKINIYQDKKIFALNKLKKFDEIPITLALKKPYIMANVTLNEIPINTKLLVDTGGSDAIWLFENDTDIKSPPQYYTDYLGSGFSGSIYGKRSRIQKIDISKQTLLNTTISFPDLQSLENLTIINGRNGSVGGEILKRFNVLIDYKNEKIYLKKNANFKDPFNYNMSGIEIQHAGLKWVSEEIQLKTKLTNNNISEVYSTFEPKNVRYKFTLKPIYEIISVRPNSPAAQQGILKGDIIHKINGVYAFKYKLQEINELMHSEEGRWITIEVERKDIIVKFKIQLKKII